MAPLDTGSVTHVLRLADPFGRGPGPSASEFATIGSAFRAIREHKGLSLAQVADATRVRRAYLSAIESGDLAPLPSRPFAVGYVRAYARVLGLDGDGAVARFKAEHPEAAEPKLRAPVGVDRSPDVRRRVIYAGLGVVVAAVALWNIAQRTLTTDRAGGAAFPASVETWPEPAPKPVLVLSAPTPPPADQTTPKPYTTPGLGVSGVDPGAQDPAAAPAAASAAASNTPGVAADPPPPASFTTRAAVYGVDAKAGAVVVQARKPASLVVRGPQGTIYFARELEAGEAYRAPLGRGLTADVSDPSAFEVYLNGRLQGALTDPLTPLDKASALAATPAPPKP